MEKNLVDSKIEISDDINRYLIDLSDRVLSLHDKFIEMSPDKEDEQETELKMCIRAGLTDAYNKGASKTGFSEEDMRKCFIAGKVYQRAEQSEYFGGGENQALNFNEYLQSLSGMPKEIQQKCATQRLMKN